MAAWNKLQGGLGAFAKNVQGGIQSIDLSGASATVTKSFGTIAQQIKEQTGRVDEADVTELPEDYLVLERRVDALRNAHQSFLNITKAYEKEGYDYPVQLNESLTEFSQNFGHNISIWASSATKGTNLPQIAVLDKPQDQHKTLSHALSRAAASGAVSLEGGSSQAARLAIALQEYAVAQDQIGTSRLQQDAAIARDFNAPWSATLNSQINAAMKARANVKSTRLALDASRARAKALTGAKAEQGRLEVEAAEEALVNATEEAISLMRAVLDSPTPLTGLAALAKAQQVYHAQAAQILAGIQASLEESATGAEAEYRKSRV